MKKADLIKVLDKYLPHGCAVQVVELLVKHPVHFKIVRPRKTKLGDFRYANGKMMITINGDLNQYEFLITTLHEIAHLQTHINYGRRVQPHGKEWKATFQEILIPFVQSGYLPNDVQLALNKYLSNPKASSCSDQALVRVLKRYSEKSTVMVEDLPLGSVFQLNNYTFVKGKKARTRYKCQEMSTKKFYMVSGIAEVNIN